MKKMIIIAAVLGAGAIGVASGSGATNKPNSDSAAAKSATIGHTAKHHHHKHKAKPEMTTSQANALKSAKDYISFQAFSRKGLIGQLSSSAGEGYPKADAVFAVTHLHADWNAQAVKSAKDYLGMQSFSKSGLIDQLSSSAGEGFTRAQAEYAADKVY